jgi:Fe-S-cluster containining protein
MKYTDLLATVPEQHTFMERCCAAAISNYSAKGGTIHCKKACGNCCTLAVNCTAPEALLISSYLDDTRKNALLDYIGRFKEKVTGVSDLKSYLRLHRQELGYCPFLEEGICGIYATRPISCRSLLSTKESRWCGADFSELDQGTKESFINSLDRSQVAFPMHYLAATQQAGQSLENQLSMRMMQDFHLSLYGSMPVLVHLFAECNLMEAIASGADAVRSLISAKGFESPFILQVDTL